MGLAAFNRMRRLAAEKEEKKVKQELAEKEKTEAERIEVEKRLLAIEYELNSTPAEEKKKAAPKKGSPKKEE
ncbi:hypothetical protein [Jeotgalibacillus soli]|uniref:Uncharacterized protein n=1 Tax=Jeotgalibacillus soli TaxID=889306 RepID=A0A0C2V9W8_9BACL|nr:hypothetical protein [Jeotgalibacillus soli]KIL45757.1 hypothetical protein KP78_21060 [Jeotgalibacillus soli]